jgi:hypothetical protein
MWWLGWGFGGLSLLLFLLVGGLWLRLNVAPMTLPAALHDRIEARLDAAMVQGRLDIGDMALDLPEGGRAPVVEFRDVRLFDPDGAPRAAFPALRVQLEAGPILSGQVRPKRVEIAGAGLRLSRDAGGRFDLDLSGAEETATVTLPETMARLDAMFAAPAFDALQEVTATGLQLSMADAMTGQTMRIQDATARLTRRAGQLTLTVGGALEGSRNSRMDIAILRRAAEAETEIAAVFRDLAARDLATVSPALAWLDLARAPISGRLALQLGDDGTVGDLEARLDIGQGRVWLGQDSAPLGFDRIGADMLYDPDTRRLTFSALRLDAAELRFAAEGYADVAADGGSFVSQFRLSGIEAEPEGLFDAPRAIEGATVDMRLTLRPRLRIELGQATVFDGDLRVHAEGRVEATGEGLAVALDATLPEADLATVLSYWPEAAIPETRRWVSEQMDEATVQGVDFAWRSGPGEAPVQALQMSLSDMVMRPLRAGPPIRDASGVLELMGRRLVVRLDAGTLAGAGGGPVDMAGTTMVVEETGTPGPEADFRIAGQGRLSDILTLLGGPPFDIFREGTLTPDRIGDGQVTLRTTFRTRLEERDTPATLAELGLAAEAVVTGFASDTLVPGRELRADRLSVALSPDRLSVSGPASLSGVPVTGTWTRPMGPEAERASVLEARAVMDRPGLSALGVVLPDWLMSGQGAAELRLDSDRRRAGPPAGRQRSRRARPVDPRARLAHGAGGDRRAGGRGSAGRDAGGHGAEPCRAGPADDRAREPAAGRRAWPADVERLRLGSWLDVAGALVGRGAGVSPAVEIDGGRLSLRDAPNLGGGGAPGHWAAAGDGAAQPAGARPRPRADRPLRQFRGGRGAGGRLRGARQRPGGDRGHPVARTLRAGRAGPVLRRRRGPALGGHLPHRPWRAHAPRPAVAGTAAELCGNPADRGPAPARRARHGGASEPDLGRGTPGTAQRRRHQPRHGGRALHPDARTPDADRGSGGRPLARHLDGRGLRHRQPPIRHAGGCVAALHGQWARRRAVRAAPGGAFRVFLPPDRHGAAIQRVREPPVDPDPRHLPRDLPPPAAGADRNANRMKLDDFDFDLPEAADRDAARPPALLRAAPGGRGADQTRDAHVFDLPASCAPATG